MNASTPPPPPNPYYQFGFVDLLFWEKKQKKDGKIAK